MCKVDNLQAQLYGLPHTAPISFGGGIHPGGGAGNALALQFSASYPVVVSGAVVEELISYGVAGLGAYAAMSSGSTGDDDASGAPSEIEPPKDSDWIDFEARKDDHWLSPKADQWEKVTGKALDDGGEELVDSIVRDVIDNPYQQTNYPDHIRYRSYRISAADGRDLWLEIRVAAPKHRGKLISVRFYADAKYSEPW